MSSNNSNYAVSVLRKATNGWVIAFLSVFVGGLFAYFWRFGFSSDYAMIGLIAKRILDTGEQFIFVPSVGYQGLLYEANLVALMFKLFGISPITLNFAPLFTYLAFCFVFYHSVRVWHGRFVAQLASLVVILSFPELYMHLLRTQPNYGETYLMGSALFLIYKLLIDRLSFVDLQSKAHNQEKSTLGLLFLFGFIAGFGLYTYGQIVYFLAVIGLHLTFLVIKIELSYSNFDQSSANIYKKDNGRLFYIFLKGVGVYIFLGFISFLFSITDVRIGGVLIRWTPLALMSSGSGIFLGLLWFSSLRRYGKIERSRKELSLSILVVIWSMVLGYLPALYYKWVERGSSLNRLDIQGSFEQVKQRAGILFNGHSVLLNLTKDFPLSWVSFLFLSGCILYFIFDSSQKLAGWLKISKFAIDSTLPGSTIVNQWKAISPFFILIFIVPCIFLSAEAVVDVFSIRYAYVLYLAYCVSLGVAVEGVIRDKKEPGTRIWNWKSVGAVLGVFCLLGTNSVSIFRALKDIEREHFFLEPVIEYLKEKNLNAGYGDYWYSYATTFLTREQLIIEPLGSNYLPFYATRVAGQKRIAYLDSVPYKRHFAGVDGKRLEILGSHYRVVDHALVGQVDIYTLEKILANNP